jgi:hypothetical protein
MKKRFTETQIAFALRQTASGTPVSEITRKMGVSDVTFYRWKKLYANLVVSEIRRLKQLRECLALEVNARIRGIDVVNTLEHISISTRVLEPALVFVSGRCQRKTQCLAK